MPPGPRDQLDRVRARFTRTAEQFAKFSLGKRSAEADQLVRLAGPGGEELALDLACGPGTFTRAFAPHVRRILGLDLTPALLAQAREAAAQAGLGNTTFVCGEATRLPLVDASLELAVCGYSLHHFAEPGAALVELARVVRRGGRLGVVDLIAPDETARAEANNRIERARDASHVRTLAAGELIDLVESCGFHLLRHETGERWRQFDDWMRIAGWEPGDAASAETRRLMLASMKNDAAGFHPRFAAGGDELEFVQTSLFVVAEKA